MKEEMQQKIEEFQDAQQQARLVLSQKYQMELQLAEAKNALEELKKLGKTEVHKVIGHILIKSDPETITKELNEKIESLGFRLKSLDKQENKLRETLKALQQKIQGFAGAEGMNTGA